MGTARQVIDKKQCIGIIYTVNEGDYTVKVIDHGTDIIPENWRHDVKHFKCVEDAKAILKRYAVNKAYLAFSTTYDEFGTLSQETHKTRHRDRYDYMPISL